MTNNSGEPNAKDWDLCCRYVDNLRRNDLSPHEPWELELETWANNREHVPRPSTIHRLRLRFPDQG